MVDRGAAIGPVAVISGTTARGAKQSILPQMSTNIRTADGSTTDTRDEQPTLGSRENYWGGSEEPTAEAYDVDDADEETASADHAGIARDRWISGTILRGAPETSILCPQCYTELTDPEHYVEPSEVELELEDDDGEIETVTELRYADHRRHRHCPECAEVAWGGLLADVEKPVFLEIVDRVLSALGHALRDETRSDLRESAADRKSAGLSDVANLERLLIELRTGVLEDDE